jgi:hypothetical protein
VGHFFSFFLFCFCQNDCEQCEAMMHTYIYACMHACAHTCITSS